MTTDPGAVFDELGVDAVITQVGGPLAFWLAAHPEWQVLANDQVALAAVRQGTSCRPSQ